MSSDPLAPRFAPEFHGPPCDQRAEIEYFQSFFDSVKRGEALFLSKGLKENYATVRNRLIYGTVQGNLGKVVKYLVDVERRGRRKGEIDSDYFGVFADENLAEAAWVACGLVGDGKALELIEARIREGDEDADEEIDLFHESLTLLQDGAECKE
jgi:hypothetical protein